MAEMKDVKTSTMEELEVCYEFGASAIREFLEKGEELSPWFVHRFLEITDEIVRRSAEQNEEVVA